jgi:Fur family transcriptional regulator, ferric uptake regulator
MLNTSTKPEPRKETPRLARGGQPIVPEKLVRRDPVDPSSFKRIIREMGLKVTQQRLAILESLNAGRAHVTAQEVFELVNVQHPEIGFATVYRFLRKMAEQKLVTEVRMGGLPARYELTPHNQHHDHLTCTRCGQIVEFECPGIEDLQVKVAHDHHFRLTHHVLELYGLCARCQKTE